jgi:hypothetical protein
MADYSSRWTTVRVEIGIGWVTFYRAAAPLRP